MLFIIREPVTISFDEIDIDEHLPSIQFKLNIEADCLSYSFSYNGNIWVTCNALSDFIASVKNNANELFLSDINGNIIFSLNRKKDGYYNLLLNQIKKSVDKSEISICYCVNISPDIFAIIKNNVLTYPVWW